MLKLVAWLNILTQVALPLAGPFTPLLARADDGKHFLNTPAGEPQLQTRLYTLSPGENIDTVAQKYNMTSEALRRLNQLRTFAHGIDNLQSGDELEVPAAPLPAIQWDKDSSGTFGNEPEHKMAGVASQAGNFLNNDPNGDTAQSMARGMAAGATGSEIQQWLSRFGTARVQLDVDKNFSLKNSQLDLLVPLYEQKDSLVFTQSSLHRTDERTQTNLGMGYRRFADGWMLGGNTFLDYDLSRDHARLGLGIEYWRDFMKLGVNSYHRLTSWKDAPELEDYQARPANGWDLRSQAWLPALPQLGGKLTYEQYYGNEVALFGKDNRQRNPHAITVGITYTPVPLLTVSAEQRQGKSGENDARFGVEANYQLGVPWRQQVNPDAVAAMRSLVGSRYDLVERNNNIVLEYRKKEVIRLKTADLVKGYDGEQKSLGVSVNSKYALERIDWSASSLIAAGGKIVQNGADWMVVMPAYRSGTDSVNNYKLIGVAVDKKGNLSNQSETQVTVEASPVNAVHSIFTPASSILPADGKTTQLLTLSIRDDNDLPVDIAVNDIEIIAEKQADATVSSLQRKDLGVMELTVTAGIQPTTLSLTPIVQGIKIPVAQIIVSDSTPDAQQSSFTASPETILADNKSLSVLSLNLKNKDGVAVGGIKDQLSVILTQESSTSRTAIPVTISDLHEEQAGKYTATLKGYETGKFKLVPQYKGDALDGLSVTVTLKADSAVQVNSTIGLDAAGYVAGADMTVTVTLKDKNGQQVTGESAALTPEAVNVANAILKSGSRWSDNGDGTYTATYLAQTVGENLKASVTLSDWSTPSTSADYAIAADTAALDRSGIEPDNTDYVIGDDMIITVTLKDKNGYAVTGQAATLTPANVTIPHALMKAGSSWSDAGNGTYTATYVATEVASDTMGYFKLPDWQRYVQMTKSYKITARSAAQANSGIETDNSAYVAGADIGIMLTLKDADGKPVSGQAASLTDDSVTVQNATLKSGSRWSDNGDGTYTATYLAQTAGENLKASVMLSDWSTPSKSADYAIMLETEAPDSINTHVNSYTYNVTSEEGTFPTTAFKEATFTIVPKNSASASNYTWTSNVSWTSVTNGVVKFTGMGNRDKVIITGIPTSGQGKIIRYSFVLKHWFINNGSTDMKWGDANTYCSAQAGYGLPTVAQIILHNSYKSNTDRGTGALWNEWGKLNSYTGSGFYSYRHWTSESSGGYPGTPYHYVVYLTNGTISDHDDSISSTYVLCNKDL